MQYFIILFGIYFTMLVIYMPKFASNTITTNRILYDRGILNNPAISKIKKQQFVYIASQNYGMLRNIARQSK